MRGPVPRKDLPFTVVRGPVPRNVCAAVNVREGQALALRLPEQVCVSSRYPDRVLQALAMLLFIKPLF